VAEDVRIVACLWHQRSAAIGTRERLLDTLTGAPDRLLVQTCHRVEVYAAVPSGRPVERWVDEELRIDPEQRASARLLDGAEAVGHLFAVAAGLDSAVAGEPQILRQVRRSYVDTPAPHPLLARLFERALHVGREIRRTSGLSSERSVGSLAVDELLRLLRGPRNATVLVVGAGEMGKLAVRSLERHVGHVFVANRDPLRASAVAATSLATAIPLSEIALRLPEIDAVVSAADTRGTILDVATLSPRARDGELVVIDIAVPRSVAADARDLAGIVYRSVDDLPGASAQASAPAVRAALERCAVEAERSLDERVPEALDAIRDLRATAERLRAEKLARALHRLGHLSDRDRLIVEALTTTITNALLHAPTVALRARRADPAAARALFDQAPSEARAGVTRITR
jgi:glutamyl-tRNA reductase